MVEFELLRAALELPGHFFDDTSKQGRKMRKHDLQRAALGHLWGCPGRLLDALCMLRCHLAVFVSAFCRVLGYFMQKSWISTPLSNRSCFCAAPGGQDGATWAKSLTQSRSEWRKGCLEGASRSKVWTVSARCSVGVMETAGNGRNSAGTHIKPELKVYISYKTYD